MLQRSLRPLLLFCILIAVGGAITARRRGRSVRLQSNMGSLSSEEILRRVGTMDLWHWAYRNQPEIPHLGPMAQDFYELFQVGTDPRHIAVSDAIGVLFAAVQALYKAYARIEAEGSRAT